jgi:hypothetical protein
MQVTWFKFNSILVVAKSNYTQVIILAALIAVAAASNAYPSKDYSAPAYPTYSKSYDYVSI